MEYREMRKFYFECKGDLAKAEAERKARCDSPAATRLDFMIGEYPAFLLHNAELQGILSGIYRMNRESMFLVSALTPTAVQNFMHNMIFEEVQLTNEIENIHSTRQEIEESYDGIATGKPGRFQGMIRQYLALMDQGEVRIKSCTDVRALYDELMLTEIVRENPDDAPDGQIFRAKRVYVNNTHGEHVHEGLYPEREIIAAMEKALLVLGDEGIDPLIRAAAFHYLFAYIHPFYDGNGRMARFIVSSVLLRELNALIGVRMSYVILNHRAQYNNLFKDANDRRAMGDITRFVIDFLKYVDEAMKDIVQSMTERNQSLAHYGNLIGTREFPQNQRRFLLALLENRLYAARGLTIEELALECKMSTSTTRIMLKELAQYAQVRQDGRRHRYTLRLEALD